MRAGEALGLRQKGLAETLGVSEASISRLSGPREIDPETKEGELAVLLVCAAVVLYLGFFPNVRLPGQGVGLLDTLRAALGL